jgi:hypothetical protein
LAWKYNGGKKVPPSGKKRQKRQIEQPYVIKSFADESMTGVEIISHRSRTQVFLGLTKWGEGGQTSERTQAPEERLMKALPLVLPESTH